MFLISIIICLQAYILNASFSIYSPSSLINEFSTNTIHYSIANFGHIPYGRTLIGQLKLSNPTTACSPIESMANKEEAEAPFLLILRGNCTFVTKVKYAQLYGARIAIIMDDRDEESEKITMIDDGFSYSLRIPAIFIEKKDGEKLLSYLQSSDPQKNIVTITITFDIEKTEDVKYQFWISTSNRNSFRLIREFKQFYFKLSKYSIFEPHYHIWNCYACANSNYSIEAPDTCISAGRYCSLDPDGRGPATGAQVVLEDLRQICIFRVDPTNWWDYINLFDEKCIEIQVVEECSKKIMKEIGINENEVNDCFMNSFIKTGKKVDVFKDDNTILQNETKLVYQNGIQFFPSVTINNDSYKGNLDADQIFEALCSKYPINSIPEECNNVLGIYEEKTGGLNVGVILIVVFSCLIVFFLFLFFIYRKWVRTQVSEEMSSRVNEMVNQYIAFYENREKTGKKSNRVELV